MNGYVCFYNSKRIEIYAETLYEAKRKAINEFKVKRKQEYKVLVILAEKDGKEITHIAVD
jgi:hypothetical protein